LQATIRAPSRAPSGFAGGKGGRPGAVPDGSSATGSRVGVASSGAAWRASVGMDGRTRERAVLQGNGRSIQGTNGRFGTGRTSVGEPARSSRPGRELGEVLDAEPALEARDLRHDLLEAVRAEEAVLLPSPADTALDMKRRFVLTRYSTERRIGSERRALPATRGDRRGGAPGGSPAEHAGRVEGLDARRRPRPGLPG
jgi:hypothetical protein